ncbi:MAG TPA: cytochrome c [Planctomycetes bacterium]|nr:cytochrome c [Planctomycetota bacterium]
MTLPRNQTQVPRWIIAAIILVNLFLLIPPVIVARARYSVSREPRIHVFPDMDSQKKFKAQSANPLFADGRGMRLPVPGTVARGELRADEHYYWGTVEGKWAVSFPAQVTVNNELLDRGRDRFAIYCTPCHGLSGHGDGMVQRRTEFADYGAWAIGDLTAEKALAYPIGQVFNIISYGINTMPPYGSQVPVEDRWALVSWVKTLQASQSVNITSLPAEVQQRLEASRPQEVEEPKGTGTGEKGGSAGPEEGK